MNGDAAKGDGVWSSASIYTAAGTIRRAGWTLSLEGVPSTGRGIKDDLAVIMPVKRLTPEDIRGFLHTGRTGFDKDGACRPETQEGVRRSNRLGQKVIGTRKHR